MPKKVTKKIQPQIKVEQIGSKSGDLSKYDYKSWAIYTLLAAVSIIFPYVMNLVANLNLPPEIIAGLIFICNSILVLVKKKLSDKSNIYTRVK